MLYGVLTDALAVVVGGAIGAGLGDRIAPRVRDALPMAFGLCAMGLGITLVTHAKTMPSVMLAMVIGTILGELASLEIRIAHVAGRVRHLAERFFPPPAGLTPEVFLDKFVAIVVLFSISGTGIFGALHEGMTGDASILIVKAILDVFTALVFAATLGPVVCAIALPQWLVQMACAGIAQRLMPITTPTMLDDFTAVGALILLATGLRICGIKSFAVGNMLPALLLIMPFTALWHAFV